MNMLDWAEREVEIACARERNDNTEDEFGDYYRACYESALKAFKSLLDDGHNGFSISVTKNILYNLIDGKPLTPIEDTPDVWENRSRYSPEHEYVVYQCKRMSSLFKDVYDDGTVRYFDTDRFHCVNVNHPTISYRSSLVSRLMNDMFPITMPYCPDGHIRVYCEDFLTDPENGDFDTVGIYYAMKPDGERIDIYRYFKDGGDDMEEISREEYEGRKRMAEALRGD